ncbi:MAG TPA: hypothetical protein VEL74_15750 [Thermoanaerobaculia bacterium]|nr:hypothetical protein [Thermoanaerobaculia bacterium]
MKKKSAPGWPSSDSSRDPQREVVYEPEYLRASEQLSHRILRATEALQQVESFLSRRPELGLALRSYSPSEFGTWITKPLDGVRIRVLYHYDERTVTMLDAWLIRDSPF